MLLIHAGLACSTEDKADKFYRDLLGLKKSEPKCLTAELSKAIFSINADLQIINYTNDNTHFEIFITDPRNLSPGKIGHLCLAVDDLPNFIEKCRSLQLEVALIPKGEKTLTFIRDFDGNLFEIKKAHS